MVELKQKTESRHEKQHVSNMKKWKTIFFRSYLFKNCEPNSLIPFDSILACIAMSLLFLYFEVWNLVGLGGYNEWK